MEPFKTKLFIKAALIITNFVLINYKEHFSRLSQVCILSYITIPVVMYLVYI